MYAQAPSTLRFCSGAGNAKAQRLSSAAFAPRGRFAVAPGLYQLHPSLKSLSGRIINRSDIGVACVTQRRNFFRSSSATWCFGTVHKRA